MIMRKVAFWACIYMLCILGMSVSAQEPKQDYFTIQKRTLLAEFETEYVLPVSERIALKQERISYQRQTKKILDTLQVSDRKRRRLLKELKRRPFSEKVKENIAAASQKETAAEIVTNH